MANVMTAVVAAAVTVPVMFAMQVPRFRQWGLAGFGIIVASYIAVAVWAPDQRDSALLGYLVGLVVGAVIGLITRSRARTDSRN